MPGFWTQCSLPPGMPVDGHLVHGQGLLRASLPRKLPCPRNTQGSAARSLLLVFDQGSHTGTQAFYIRRFDGEADVARHFR